MARLVLVATGLQCGVKGDALPLDEDQKLFARQYIAVARQGSCQHLSSGKKGTTQFPHIIQNFSTSDTLDVYCNDAHALDQVMLRTIKLIPGMVLHKIRAAFAPDSVEMLAEGAEAPDFKVQDESGNEHSLHQYKGRRVLLWWFIRASTPG